MILHAEKRSFILNFAVFLTAILLPLYFVSCEQNKKISKGSFSCSVFVADGIKNEYRLELMNNGKCVIEIGEMYKADSNNNYEVCFFTCADAEYILSDDGLLEITPITVSGVKMTSKGIDETEFLKTEFDFPSKKRGDINKLVKGDAIPLDRASSFGIPVHGIPENVVLTISDDGELTMKRYTYCNKTITIDDRLYEDAKVLYQFKNGILFLESAFFGENTLYTKDYYSGGGVKLITYYLDGVINETIRYDEFGNVVADPVYQ